MLTLVLLFLVRFVVADAAIYAEPRAARCRRQAADAHHDRRHRCSVRRRATGRLRPAPARAPVRRAPTSRYLPYRYAIHGVLTIGSQVPLRELEYFRAQWLGNDVDLSVRVGRRWAAAPRGRAPMTQHV